MTKIEIISLKAPVHATIRMPGSKSYTNRALIMAALTQGPVCLKNPLYSDDTEAMISCLRTLGLSIQTEPDQLVVQNDISCIKLDFVHLKEPPSRLLASMRSEFLLGDIFKPTLKKFSTPECEHPEKSSPSNGQNPVENKSHQLFARDSGTTVRFMLALLCIVPSIKTIKGSPRLNERPIKDLVDALRQLGAEIAYCDKEGQLPVTILTSTLPNTSVFLKSDLSSQFCSALLLISPYLSNGLTIHRTGPLISKPYIDMTIHCMQDWGVSVVVQEDGAYFIQKHQCYQKKQYIIEGDFSSAGYFFAIAALTKSTIILENLNPNSAQADRKFLSFLEKMGNIISFEENKIRIQGKQILPVDIDMEDCPDQVMTMAVLAAFAKGVTKISGVRSLRVKETERVLALKTELAKMGIKTEDTHDTLTIYGGSPHKAEIETYNDHRMAMSFAVAGMYLPGIVICHPEVVNKTFPTFWEILSNLQ